MSQNRQFVDRVLFTLLILVLYRFGTYISLPLIDLQKIADFAAFTRTSGIFSTLNVFSGGAISKAAIFGLGVMPQITASIIMQLVMSSFPSLKQMKMEAGPDSQRKISLITRLLTIAIGLMQGFAIAESFVSVGLYSGSLSVMSFKIVAALLMTVGTMILVWMGETCSSYGIGNGLSLIIFASIVSDVPADTARVLDLARSGVISGTSLLLLIFVFVATISFVVFVERSNRLIYVQYPRQAQNFMNKRASMPKDNFIPFKLNTAGIIPPIFASAMLALPVTLVNAIDASNSLFSKFITNHIVHGTLSFSVIYAILIVLFSFFYNNVIFDSDDIAENLKKGNVFIPGCRPGAATASLLRDIVNRLSCFGSLYMVIVCLIPESLSPIYGRVFFIGGTSVLIAIGVITDTVASVQTVLMSSKYSKIMKRYDRR